MSGAEKYIDDDEMPMDVMCDDLFDHIDDLLDFPNYDAVAADYMVMEGGLSKDQDITHYTHNQQQGAPFSPPPLPLPAPPRVDGLLGSDNRCAMPIAGTDSHTNDKLLDELDIADLEWVSNFMDDSSDSYSLDFSNTAHMIHVETTTTQHETMFRTTSPVSVLQSNSLTSSHGGSVSSSSSSSSFSYSSNAGNVFDNRRPKIRFTNSPKPSMPLAIPARARSKRPRPATFSIRPHVTIPILPPSSTLPPPPLDLDNFEESRTPPAIDYKNTKKYKKNLSVATPLWTSSEDTTPAPPGIRKCMHCEIQKTPQWRAGPMGPKTLCNACGVRYKSGRLFPEYRPAASPTFVPSIHSNSHKKVVEMRINCTPKARLESCDLLDYIRRS